MSVLQAGREADRLVAEVLFGMDLEKEAKRRFREYARQNAGVGMIGNEKWPDDCIPSKREYFRSPKDRFTSPDYNIKPVLDRLRELGIETWMQEIQSGWVVTLWRGLSVRIAQSRAPALPLALCSAAVEALEGTDV